MCISIKWITIRGFCEPIHNVFQHRRMLGPSCIHYVLVVRHWCTHRKIGNLLDQHNVDALRRFVHQLLGMWIGIALKEMNRIYVFICVFTLFVAMLSNWIILLPYRMHCYLDFILKIELARQSELKRKYVVKLSSEIVDSIVFIQLKWSQRNISEAIDSNYMQRTFW